MHKTDVNTTLAKKQSNNGKASKLPASIEMQGNATTICPMAAADKQETIKTSAEHYAFGVVEVSSLGKCCVDDTLLYWDALKELANINGLTDRDRLNRLNAIAGLVTAGHRFAYDMSSLMESEHCDHLATYDELMATQEGHIMAKANSTQSAEVTRSSLADIASTLESSSCHLEAMLKVSFAQLSNIGADVSAGSALETVSGVQSLLDAARNYLDEVKEANRLLYEQAWKLPNQPQQAA